MTAPNSVSIDDVEAALQPPTTPSSVTSIKLEGDDVPEDLRGKSVAELLQMQKNLEQSLKLSEHARLSSQVTSQQPTPVTAPQPEPELTDEQLAEMYQENPIKAIRAMQEQAERRVAANMESRLGTLASGTAATVEAQVRQKYPDEFAVLGAEISKVIHELPDRNILTDPKSWDKLIGYVRGLEGNYEKMIEHRTRKTTGIALSQAREREAANAGLSFAPSGYSAPAPSGAEDFDDYTKEIAKNLGMSLADYAKWRKIT